MKGLLLKATLEIAHALDSPEPSLRLRAAQNGPFLRTKNGRIERGVAQARCNRGRTPIVGQAAALMMKARLRALERKLAIERVEQRVWAVTQQWIREWEEALAQNGKPPAPMLFVRRLTDAGVYLPTIPRVVTFLIGRQQTGKVPTARDVVQKLLPWWQSSE